MKRKKGYLQISFAWLFAIIVGAVILFLAIYSVTKLGKTSEQATTAQAGKEIGVLLNPLETGFESSKVTTLSLSTDTRIYNQCNNFSTFGEQGIQLAQKNFNRWTTTDQGTIFLNKYIFSRDIVEGQDFYIFSKPFDFPYKVSDVIYLTSSKDSYCFVDAPSTIESELKKLDQKNIFFTDCPAKSRKVCFTPGNNCDVSVNQNLGTVTSENGSVSYETDALMYGAIFSSPEIYECQVERLMKRGAQLAYLYNDKAILLTKQGCPLDIEILSFGSLLGSYKDSSELTSLLITSKNINAQNSAAECELW